MERKERKRKRKKDIPNIFHSPPARSPGIKQPTTNIKKGTHKKKITTIQFGKYERRRRRRRRRRKHLQTEERERSPS